jgi:hypothetical protein
MIELVRDDPANRDRQERSPIHVMEAIAAADEFLVGLMTSALAEWHARAVVAAAPGLMAAAQALVQAVYTPEMAYAAWLVHDHVETACHRFESLEGRCACPRRRVRDVRDATERAALARFAQASLSQEHYHALCGGFTSLLSLSA